MLNVNKALRLVKGLAMNLILPGEDLIDWYQVAGIAFNIADADQGALRALWPELSAEFDGYVKRVEPAVADFTHLEPAKPLAQPVVFDRREWVVVTIDTIKPLVQPIFTSLVRTLANNPGEGLVSRRLVQTAASAEIGLVLGYLAKRVLGQYDVALMSTDETAGRLYFIYPNIVQAERKLGVEPERFRLWLALHETTHSYQFEANPWLRSYLQRLLDDHTRYVQEKIERLVGQAETPINSSNIVRLLFTRSLREIMSPEENEVLARAQAFMSLVEGYSEYVMGEAALKLIPGAAELGVAFEQARRHRTWAEWLLERLIGFELKLQQYRLGKAFVQHTVEAGGIDLANQAWAGPENLPSLREIRRPELWVERIKATS